MDPNTRKEHEAKARAMLVDGTQVLHVNRGRNKPQQRRDQQEQHQHAAAAGFQQHPAARAQNRQRRDDVGSTSRLEQEVVSSRLWEPVCQQLQRPLPEAVPTTFDSLEQYIDTFEPLLFEEAAESIRATVEESERAGRGVEVTVQLCAPMNDGWFNIRLAAATQEAAADLKQLQQDRDAAVVVLQLPAAAAAGSSRSTPPLQQQQLVCRASGLLRNKWDTEQGVVHVHIRPCCGRHEQTPESPCCKVLQYLQQQQQQSSPDRWQLLPAGSLVTATREYSTLARMQQIPILDYILNPSKYPSSRSSSSGSTTVPAAANLPAEVSSPGFRGYLHNSFDLPQIEAIKCSATHLANNAQQQQQQNAQDPDGDMEVVMVDQDRSRSRSGSPAAAAAAAAPFTLIQGPPGTGKTHTVLGVLNTWHLVQFQRFYMSLDNAVRGLAESGAQIERELISDEFPSGLAQRPRILVCAPSNGAIDELLERILRGTFRDVNGHIYRPDVVRLGSEEALSTEARQVWVEQLAGRFLSHNPASYTAELNEQQTNMRMIMTRMRNVAQSLYAMKQKLQTARDRAAQGAADAEQEAATYNQQLLSLVGQVVTDFEQLRKTKANLSRLALVENRVAGSGAAEWGRRLAAIQARSQHHHHHHHQQQQQQIPVIMQSDLWRSSYRQAQRELQIDLEMSFVEQAEMVFTTLSSSARDVFKRLKQPFELVLIDEAAQAAEIAALQPLIHGAKAVVMVGDPQQLPATIFSQAAKQLALERSLFERLAAAGCPVNMLKVQYRMHPAIRTFPSDYFYSNALIDAPSVLARPRPWFYPPLNPAAAAAAGSSDGSSSSSSDGVLIPYVVYDVSKGRERYVKGKSPENELEARMAVALYGELRRLAAARQQQQQQQDKIDVGVITPYRGQSMLLKRLFTQAYGKDILNEVKIATIDSFQGKQRDIIILTCVRASSSSSSSSSDNSSSDMRPAKLAVQKAQQREAGQDAPAAAAAAESEQQQQLLQNPKKGIGFLEDTRRMNVAITRAKQALYILGHTDTLVSHPAWESLIADAGLRNCVIWDAVPEDISNPTNRNSTAQKLRVGRQLQEDMVPQQQQQQQTVDPQQQELENLLAGNADAQQQQQQQRQSPSPPAAAAATAGDQVAAAAAAAAAAGSSKDWLVALQEKQDAERKRQQDEQQAKQQGRLKKLKLTGADGQAAAAAAAAASSDVSEGNTPTAAAAATEQQQHQLPEPSRLQQQSRPEQQQQQQQDLDEVLAGVPGDGFEPYHGMTVKQGAIYWLLTPLVQQSLIKLLLAMTQQQRQSALAAMKQEDLAWVLPCLQQQQQQQQGVLGASPSGPGNASGTKAAAVAMQPEGGQMLLPGGIQVAAPPAAAAATSAQQLVMQPVGPSSTRSAAAAAAAAAGGQLMLLPATHSPRLQSLSGPQPGTAAAAAAAQPPVMILGPAGLSAPLAAAAAAGFSNAPPPAAAVSNPNAPPGLTGVALNPTAAQFSSPPQQQQQQQYVLNQDGVFVPASTVPPAASRPTAAAAAAAAVAPRAPQPPAAAAAGGANAPSRAADKSAHDTPPTAKQLKRIARNERRRREREIREMEEGLRMAEQRETERLAALPQQQQQTATLPPWHRQQRQQQGGDQPPPWRQQQQQRQGQKGGRGGDRQRQQQQQLRGDGKAGGRAGKVMR